MYTPCFKQKLDPLLFHHIFAYELHENFQRYTEGVACCEYGMFVTR